jgi:hypothetical protein
MATRTAKNANGSHTSKIGLAMAALAAVGAVRMLNTKSRRTQLTTAASKVGKAAATLIATSEVLKNGGALLRRKPRSRLSAWLNG